MRPWVLFAMLNASVAFLAQQPETMSLLEKPLFAPPLASEERSRREAALAAARAAAERSRWSIDDVLTVARAQMALGRVGDGLETLTRALETKPDDPRLTLERARGLIVIRKFELAAKEARKPVAPLPEAACVVGMSQYLTADYAHARESFAKCADPGIFAYLADWRTGPSAMPRPTVSRDPTPDPSPEIRFPGTAKKPGPTTRIPLPAVYLDAAEGLIHGKAETAKAQLKQIVEKYRNDWMDPVYIAAEADYVRILKAEPKKKKKKL